MYIFSQRLTAVFDGATSQDVATSAAMTAATATAKAVAEAKSDISEVLYRTQSDLEKILVTKHRKGDKKPLTRKEVQKLHHVFGHANPDKLKEIIVVDDGTMPPLSDKWVNTDIQDKYGVKLIRHNETVGLIGAKKTGGDAATYTSLPPGEAGAPVPF